MNTRSDPIINADRTLSCQALYGEFIPSWRL